MQYEIPLEGSSQLYLGSWVEIFETYDKTEEKEALRVRSMRIGDKTLIFGRKKSKNKDLRANRPDEGEIVFIDWGIDKTCFTIDPFA